MALVVESAGGGLVALQELRASVDLPVVEFPVKGSNKMARNEAVSPLAEAGKVWLPSPRIAPWIGEWIAERVGYPQVAHDDRCEAAVMALQRLKGWLEPAHVMLPPRWEYRDYGSGYAYGAKILGLRTPEDGNPQAESESTLKRTQEWWMGAALGGRG